MLMMKTRQLISQVLVWCSDSSLPENEKSLVEIRQWWASLEGKTIRWEVFSETINPTQPVIREFLVVENPLIEGIIFSWRKQGLENCNSIPVQHLVLDSALHQLDIIPNFQDGFVSNYRVKIVN